MLPSDYFALQAWRTKYTILEAGVKWSQSNDVCLLVTKILVAGLRRCVGCLLVGWFSESRIRNWQKTWLAMFTLAVFDESLKKNEMWQQIIRKLLEKKLSECEDWGKLGWDGLGKVQEGLFMREVSWPSPPQQSIQKIHKFKYTNKIHKYKYTNTGGVPRTQRQIRANACYQAVIQIVTVPTQITAVATNMLIPTWWKYWTNEKVKRGECRFRTS